MNEFFVVRAVRRTGIGRAAAVELLGRYPGRWESRSGENPGRGPVRAPRRTKRSVRTWREDRRPVPGKPHLPPDVWITSTS